MDRAVPKSNKYAGVQGKLDTGLTINKVKTVSSSQFAQRRDEIFFRISRHQLFELYNEYEADEYEDIAEAETRHIGARGPIVVTHADSDRADYAKPYLLLDVREEHAFNAYHMLQARCFPFVLMRRDRSPPELNKFKNKPEHLVIVVADDEKLGRDAAKTLVDRGCDNVYLLSGGINDFAIDYPSFIEGTIPEGLVSTSPGIDCLVFETGNIFHCWHIGYSAKPPSRMPSGRGPTSSRGSPAGPRSASRGFRDDVSDAGSEMSTRSGVIIMRSAVSL